MMTTPEPGRSFRRPAALDTQEAESIVGDADPAGDAEVAHTSAWGLMGVPSDTFDADHVTALRKTVSTQGVDTIADLWDRSPAFTLPGALWRLYLVWQWNELDSEALSERFDEGSAVLHAQGVDANVDLSTTLESAHRVLSGKGTEDDLADALASAGRALQVMAVGTTYGPDWVLEDNHQLAHPVTRRPQALLATASELIEGSHLARAGELN